MVQTTFGRRWVGYLSVVLLIGLIGGIAMASIAAGRRTQSSYPTFLASTNPSDLTVSVYNTATGAPGPSLTAKIARLAGVKRVVSIWARRLPLAANGAPLLDEAVQVAMASAAWTACSSTRTGSPSSRAGWRIRTGPAKS